MTSELPVTRWQAAEKGRPDVKWQMADVKTLGFCHLPSDIRHSGCVFQHPARFQGSGLWSPAGNWKLEAGSWDIVARAAGHAFGCAFRYVSSSCAAFTCVYR